MRALVRGSDLVGLPVVTVAGDDVAEVRDVLFDAEVGHIVGFTLNRRGRLARRMKSSLNRGDLLALGPDAVMVRSEDAVHGDTPAVTLTGAGGNVIGDRVLTDGGVLVGSVTDVVVDTGDGAIVGYEVEAVSEAANRHGRHSYLPLPDVGAVSGEALVVPAAAVEYVTADFAGFAEAVDRYRSSIRRDQP